MTEEAIVAALESHFAIDDNSCVDDLELVKGPLLTVMLSSPRVWAEGQTAVGTMRLILQRKRPPKEQEDQLCRLMILVMCQGFAMGARFREAKELERIMGGQDE